MIIYLYRKYISDSWRKKIYQLFLGKVLLILRQSPYFLKSKIIYYFSILFPKNEYYDAYRFAGKYGITNHPFESSLIYADILISVKYDENLPYVVHNGKRLYFPKDMSEHEIIINYRYLLIEQDVDSPHRYIDSYQRLQDKILLDIGGAEGVFTLDAIDYIKEGYIFECQKRWIEALQRTFSPWNDKIKIIRKFVGENDSDETITLDSFLKDNYDNLHLKMDIEGSEISALKGATNMLTRGKNISFSICTYHKKDDCNNITSLITAMGYDYVLTKGYMYCSSMCKAICRSW